MKGLLKDKIKSRIKNKKDREKNIKKGDKVHVESGILNYVGYIEEIINDSSAYLGFPCEEKIYIINGHCYFESDFKKIK